MTKKRFLPQIIIRFLDLKTLPYVSSSLAVPKKFCFIQIIPCRCPKNCGFAQIFETWEQLLPFPLGWYDYK